MTNERDLRDHISATTFKANRHGKSLSQMQCNTKQKSRRREILNLTMVSKNQDVSTKCTSSLANCGRNTEEQ